MSAVPEMKSKPLVSIVNVTWNGKHLLEQHLPSLRNLKYSNYEVIIVDNASNDGSTDFVNTNYPEFQLIQNSENLGTAEGSNVAIKSAEGKYLFWISNDMEFDPYILNHLVDRCESDDSIGICTVKMRRIINDALVHEIDSVGAEVDIFGFPVSRGINQGDDGRFDHYTEIFFSFGGAMFIRRDLLDKIGGFDLDYFTLTDDIDLSWRVHLYGYKVVVEPKAFLYHRVSATLGSTHNRAQKRYLSERNTLRTLLKNYSGMTLAAILPFHLFLLFLEMTFFLIIGKPEIARSGVRAISWNMKNFKNTLKLRNKIQTIRKVGDHVILSKMLFRSEKINIFLDFMRYRKTPRWQNVF